MLLSNINDISQSFPFVFYATAFYIGSAKISQALASGAYMVGSKVAYYMNHQDLSQFFQKTSEKHLKAVKKNLVRHLTFAVGLSIAGFGIHYALNTIVHPNLIRKNSFR